MPPFIKIEEEFVTRFIRAKEKRWGSLSQYYITQKLGSHGYPKFCLILYDLEEDRWWSGFVAEDSCISLNPHRPTNEHGEGGHSLTVWGCLTRHLCPPRLDGAIRHPLMRPDRINPKPILYHTPKPFGVSALEKHMRRRLLGLLA